MRSRKNRMNDKKTQRFRLLALDLDGTALRSDGSLSEDCKEALLSAHEAGLHIVVASGRSWTP